MAVHRRLSSLLSKDFRTAYNTAAIPPDVRRSFAKAVGTKSFDTAEPGAQWQEWDVIRYGLSPRRLKKVFISTDLCVIFYELAGFGKSSCVACFQLSTTGNKMLLSAYIPDTVVDLLDLTKAIQKKECHDIPS